MLVGKSIEEEREYLKSTQNIIDKMLSEYIDSSLLQDREIIKHRKFLWDNRSELDEIEINENCSQVALQEKIHSRKLNRIRTLERQKSIPYFARLDFKEDFGDKESFYIGLSSIEDEENFEFFVFDWRSPVSTMFYDFEMGKAHYEAPNGQIKGEILFNRQYNIKNGEIVFMHNSNESLCDEMLTDMLGGNATDKMKNIVATIQKEQNDIIRNDSSKVLYIQGAAGSGKTSIALHRAAYILYKYRKEIQADNILIFSPNEVFAEYISNVLPELGEANIGQTTFELYSKQFLPSNYKYESKNEHLEYIYGENIDIEEFKIRTKSMEFKNSDMFTNILEEFVKEIPTLVTNIKGIYIDNKEIISTKIVRDVFTSRFNNIPFINRIEVIKQSLFSQVENKYLTANDEFDYVEDRNNFYIYCKEEVNRQVDEMIETMNAVTIYKILWKNINKFCRSIDKGIRDITIEYLNEGIVKYEDITPIIYIRSVMEGFRNYKNIKHILIDESQDYSSLFYKIIKKTFKNAAVTIMGDLNQRIDKYSNVKSKESITGVFEDIKIVTITKSYRSTYNITMFSKGILGDGEPIEAVERHGDKPCIFKTSNNINKILELISEYKEKKYESIALLCKSKEMSIDLYNNIKDNCEEVNLIIGNNYSFNVGVNIMPTYLAKGLEFDAVVIVDGENYFHDRDKNILYTACTRALHKLDIITSIDIKEVLPKDNSLYIIKES